MWTSTISCPRHLRRNGSRADWKRLASLVPSKAQGAQRIHKDVRTVTRYLEALGLRSLAACGAMRGWFLRKSRAPRPRP